MIVVDKSLIRENVIIWYRLPPRQLPKNRLKLWKGKVLKPAHVGKVLFAHLFKLNRLFHHLRAIRENAWRHGGHVTFWYRETIWSARSYELRESQLQQQSLRIRDQTMEELFERHAEKLFAYLRQHTSSREDAEDILAETFMAALTETKFLYLSETAQVAWLWRVARNKVVDAFRKAAIRRHVPLEQIAETIYEDEAQAPEQMALRQDEADEIHHLLHSLSESQQEMLRLRFGYDLRCGEIAAIQGKREDAVRAMLSRTMNFLRRSYAPRSSISQSHQPGKHD